MATTVLKIEAEAAETCCVCGATGELFTPEEYDAGTPPMQLPLRAMLLHLNNNKVGYSCVSTQLRVFFFKYYNSSAPRGTRARRANSSNQTSSCVVTECKQTIH